MHEELAQELEAQYEVNRTMYEQIEAWNELFAEFQEFEVSKTYFLTNRLVFSLLEKRQ